MGEGASYGGTEISFTWIWNDEKGQMKYTINDKIIKPRSKGQNHSTEIINCEKVMSNQQISAVNQRSLKNQQGPEANDASLG